MGRRYNRTKAGVGGHRKASPEKQDLAPEKTSHRLAREYGVGHDTIEKNGKFAAAIETLRAVDPDIEATVSVGAFVGFVGSYPGGFSKIEGSPTARSGRYHGARDEWCPRLPGGAEWVEIPPLRSGGGAIPPETRRPRGSLAA